MTKRFTYAGEEILRYAIRPSQSFQTRSFCVAKEFRRVRRRLRSHLPRTRVLLAIYTHSQTNKERDSSSSSSVCQSEIVDSPGGADGQATEQQRETQAKRKLRGAGASVVINATVCVRDGNMATISSAKNCKK